ncbi:hypothetical protein ABEB36_009344 [Hypothenemus hampei]|uniref:Envelope protein n=1 Tax=Hypothenemus hampei TaxID=57062 RepID=A0ABD1EIZ8_HYPHA
MLIIPKYPYLAREETRGILQYTEEVCPIVEKTYFCQRQFQPRDECLEQLLNTSTPDLLNCPIFKVNAAESIVEQISRKTVLILPTRPKRMMTRCADNQQYVEINRSTLVQMHDQCEVEIDGRKFSNNINVQETRPLILPEVKLENLKSSKILVTLNLTKIDLEDIYRLREANNQYFPIDQLENQTRGTWPSYVLGLCFILAIILVATQWKKFRQLKLACQKKSDTNIQSSGPEADLPKPRSRGQSY